MSEKINVEHAFNPEARQAQADLNDFMDGRTELNEADFNALQEARTVLKNDSITTDRNGESTQHHTTNGLEAVKVINGFNESFDESRADYEAESMPQSYEDMSMSQLAKHLAEAEFSADSTKSEDINDILLEKLAEQENKFASEKDSDHNADRSDNLFNRVMSIKDKELKRLTEESPVTKKPVIEDDLFTYESEEELANKDQVIADKAAESEPVALDEIFDDAEVQEDTPSAEKQRSETIQDIVERIIQRRYDADDYNEDVERADYDKIEKIIASNVNKELDRKGITDPAERARQFEIGRKASYEIVQKLQDEANSRLREGNNLREDLDAIADADDVEVQPEAELDEPTEASEVVPAQPEQRKRNWFSKKVGAALLALTVLGGVAGFATESHKEDKGVDLDIGNHDKDNRVNVQVDETDDALRAAGVSEAGRKAISGNFEAANAFFETMETKEGRKNFKAMQSAYQKSYEHNLKLLNGDESAAKSLTDAEMNEFFARSATQDVIAKNKAK